MFQLAPHRLWIGHAGDGRDVARVFDAGIEAVVQLAIEEPPVVFPREIIVARVPLYDGTDNAPARLRLALATVEQLLRAQIPTLICCGAGMSRSPAVAACALAQIEGRSPQDMLADLNRRHGTDVSPGLWRDLLAQWAAITKGTAVM